LFNNTFYLQDILGWHGNCNTVVWLYGWSCTGRWTSCPWSLI